MVVSPGRHNVVVVGVKPTQPQHLYAVAALLVLPGSSKGPATTMDFNYAFPAYEPTHRTITYRPYSHHASVTYATPPFQIMPEKQTPTRPFEDRERLMDMMFREDVQDREAALDPLNFPGERANLQNRQIHFLLDHLAARHAISYQIRKNIDYREAGVSSMLTEVRSWPFPGGLTSKRASELEKQLLELNKEQWAEEVSCWRDTGRMLTDVFEHWSEYSEHSRRGRLMDFDL